VALAATTDVEAILEQSLTAAQVTHAASLLEVASAAVADYAGRKFEPGSYTVSRPVPQDGKLRLPAAVDTVSEVRSINEVDGTATVITGWTLRRNTLYGLRMTRPEVTFGDWHYPAVVEVDFTVTAAVPDDVRNITAGIVAATLSSPQVGVQSETKGPFSVSYADSSGRVWFSKSDRQVLKKYRMPKPALGI
jgi:hypothetical protein